MSEMARVVRRDGFRRHGRDRSRPVRHDRPPAGAGQRRRR